MTTKPTYEELESRIKELELIILESKQSEEGLFSIMSEAEKLAGFGAWEWDMVRDVWTMSDNWLKIHGYKRNEIKTNELLTIAHPDDKEQIREAFIRCITHGAPYEIEHKIVRKENKEVRYIRAYGRVETDSSGKPVKLYGAAQDITEYKRQEFKLIESEKKFRSFINAAQEGIWVIDKENNTTFVNPSMSKMLGYSIDEMMGKSLFYFMDYQGIELAKRKLRLRRQGKSEQHDFEFKHKNGQSIFTTIATAPIMDKEGNYDGAIAGIIDISVRKKAEEKIKNLQIYLQNIFNLSPGIICIANVKTGYFTECNPAVTTVLGYSEEEYKSKPFIEFVHPDDRKITINIISKQLAGSPVSNFQNRYQCKDGSYKWLSWVATNADKNGMVHGVATDITNIKESEIQSSKLAKDLQKKNNEMEGFIYTISHDLKSPLVTISAFSSIAKESLVSGDYEQCQKSLDFISHASKRMGQSIKELLDLSRVGIQKNPTETVNLGDLVKEAMENLAGEISKHNAIIEVESGLPNVTVDKQHFLQVIENLLENACKYSRSAKEGPNIKVGINRTGKELICYVKDNGIGIQAQYLDKIFGLFERLDPDSEGTGIGLAIVNRIIETHDERVWAESEGLGQGATFFFTLQEA